jgi:hypothetical protein
MADVEPQLDGCGDLVHILAARTGSTHVLDLYFFVRQADVGRNRDRHVEY